MGRSAWRCALALVVSSPLLLLAATAWAQEAPAPAAAESPDLAKQRDRFRQGMDRYRAGAFEAAILIWGEIYRELGSERGYRLAFNLARAYEQVNDTPHAAEHYEVYLAEVRRRRDANETIEPVVAKQEEEAGERVAELRTTLGRIRLRRPDVAVVIDAVPLVGRDIAYVTAGKHAIVFPPDPRRVEIEVAAGEVVDVEPPPAAPALPPPPVVVPAAAPIRWEAREEHPYSRSLVFVGAGVTLVSLALPAALYTRASDYRDDYDRANGRDDAAAARAERDYEGARDTAYASWAVPALLGAATIALVAYYYLGTRTVRAPVQAGLSF
ncbi:MAG: hypothetical protein KIT84_31745 [Labilithrix sp.]|nr:hypothetical protein [Labilithrix sp.]MCW5815644.1 hypothetical protein [Labilithrix sp.]